jgi:OOP family OmpA-OmpF porin
MYFAAGWQGGLAAATTLGVQVQSCPRLSPSAPKMLAAAVILCTAPALNAQSPSDYLTDSRGSVVRNATYLCWHTGYWSPAAAIAECDPDLVPRTAPVAAAPAVAPPPAKQAPAPAPAPNPAPVPLAQKVTLSAETLFDFDKSVLKPEGRRSLDELGAKVASIDLEVIIVMGHTDSIGGDAYNQKLSTRRAGAVKVYLVGKGIAANRITAEGRGEKQPVADNKTREGRARNRRVEIEVIGSGRR